MKLAPAEIYARLKAKFPEGIVDIPAVGPAADPYAVVAAEALAAACLYLKEGSDLQFDFPTCLSGVDDGKCLWVVIQLYSIPLGHRATLKAKCDRAAPRCPSVTGVWPGMNWHEREAYDLYGIVFDGHPDLRRILLPEDWEGHPLRKDYRFPEEYQGIPLR